MTRRFTGLKVLDDHIPVVEVTMRDGSVVRVAPAVLTDEAAQRLHETLHRALTGCVVRLERIPRVELRTL